MLAEAACTSLGCTSTTRSAHAHCIQHGAAACHVLFWRPHTQPPRWACPAAKAGSVGYLENSQPVTSVTTRESVERGSHALSPPWTRPDRAAGWTLVPSRAFPVRTA